MPLALTTPITVTNTATTVQITGILNKIEDSCIEIHYITVLSDGTPYQRNFIIVDGYDAVKALYAETDEVMATIDPLTGVNKTFEVASAEILYSRVLAHIGA